MVEKHRTVGIVSRYRPCRFPGIGVGIETAVVALVVGNRTVELEAEVDFGADPGIDLQRGRVTLRKLLPGRTLRYRRAHRRIVGGAFVTAGEAEGMVLCHGIAEKEVEPVGIAVDHLIDGGIEFGAAQSLGVVLVFEHLITEREVLAGIGKAGIEQIFRQLDAFAGIHQIEAAVIFALVDGNGAVVSHLGRAVAAFLGGHDNDAVGGLHTINGRCRGVFQDGNALDVVGIDTGNGITHQILGIFGQGVEVAALVPVYTVVVENDAVEHPQRRGISI